MRASRQTARRPGVVDLSRGQWILLAASASWLIVLVAFKVFEFAAQAAMGLL